MIPFGRGHNNSTVQKPEKKLVCNIEAAIGKIPYFPSTEEMRPIRKKIDNINIMCYN